VNAPDLLNVLGLAMDGSAALLLLATAPIPQRMSYHMDVEEGNAKTRKDRLTRKAHYFGFVMLAGGFLLQLVAQLLR
jgi:hypothetical protein